MEPVQTTAPAVRAWTLDWLYRLLCCIRLDEVALLQGTPLLGALFSMGPVTVGKCVDVLVLAIASSCLVAHVFLLNDWSGASTDLHDPNRAARVITTRGISSTTIGTFCVLLLLAALLVLALFGSTPVVLALALAILSALESAPGISMKGVPFASSAVHLCGGLVHFLLGYSIFHAVDGRSMLIGSFFALTFAAGHLTHEARDWASDQLSGIQTNAVRFGSEKNVIGGFALFTAADILLFALAASGVVPRILMLIAVLYPLHLWWVVQTWNAGLSFAIIRRLQKRYRMLYAIIGVAMAMAALFLV